MESSTATTAVSHTVVAAHGIKITAIVVLVVALSVLVVVVFVAVIVALVLSSVLIVGATEVVLARHVRRLVLRKGFQVLRNWLVTANTELG